MENMNRKEKEPLKKLFFFMVPLAENKKRWKGFQKFLESPLLGNRPSLSLYLNWIKKVFHLPGKDAERQLCRFIFPDKNCEHPQTIQNLRRRLNGLLEAYYAYEAFLNYQQDPIQKWKYLLHTANKAQWDPYFLWLLEKRALKELNKGPINDQHFLHLAQFAAQEEEFLSRQDYNSAESPFRYWKELNHLHHFFYLSQLKLATNIKNQSLLTKVQVPEEIPLLPTVLNEVIQKWESQPMLIQMYYLIYQALTDLHCDVYLIQLRHTLERVVEKLDRREMRQLFQHTNNLLIYRLNYFEATSMFTQANAIKDQIRVHYEFGLNSKVIFSLSPNGEYLDHLDFKNIVVLFCNFEDFSWVEDFIESKSQYILKGWRDVLRTFAWGILYFFKGEYTLAKEHILEARNLVTSTHDWYITQSIRLYYLKILFELQLYEECERVCINTEKVIHYNKHFSQTYGERTLHFCQYLGSLCGILQKAPDAIPRSLPPLLHRILEGPPCSSLNYLVQKINQHLETK